MGVNLRDLFDQHDVPATWYQGRRVAVDGHNVAFRYLTTIRTKEGDLVRNDAGRATSHLYGFLGLVRNLRASGAEPIVVWDGPTHPRKRATVEERIRRRQETLRQAEAAKARGDHAEFVRLMRGTVYITDEMIWDCTRLLEAVGVSVVKADHDGERYATGLCAAGHADAVATEDYDALVAGAPVVLRKAGGQAPFLNRLGDLERHGITGAQLRQVAILLGTDWHPGVKGFGIKTALRALKEYPDLSVLVREAEAGKATTRYHKLVAASGFSAQDFQDLDAFIADVPSPEAPRPSRPSPEVAVAVADELGVGRDRVVACFC